jgi:nicotinamidase/pyrazinamidase
MWSKEINVSKIKKEKPMNALIVVDLQYDFMPHGALAVNEGDKIADILNPIRDIFDLVVFTQDWHPANHCSFKENGGIWPVHCVQEGEGAKIDHKIVREGDVVVQKGVNQDVDSYSGFFDNERKHKTKLDEFLKANNVDTVYIAGLATDYCVKFTALDAKELGYKTFLIVDACKGVNINSDDAKKAIEEMSVKGINLIHSTSFSKFSLQKLKHLCDVYDKNYGSYPQSEFEGESVYRFIFEQIE